MTFSRQNINILIMKRFLAFFNLILFFFIFQSLSFENTAALAQKKPTKKQLEKERYMKEMMNSQPKEGFDYQKAYDNLEEVQVQFIHDEDPDEYYDTQKIYFSPYPLIRLTQTLYVQKQTIEPGFYLLTPREYLGKKCVLFKQAGKIKHIVPIFEYQTVVPELEYQKPPKKWWQIRDRYTFQTQYYERKIHAFDVYSEFYEIDLYYHDGLSKMIFKKNPY